MFWENWTTRQWINLGIFALSQILVGIGSFQTWGSIPSAFTPAAVSGFLIGVIAFARQVNTEKPRESFTTRRTDPDPAPELQKKDPPPPEK